MITDRSRGIIFLISILTWLLFACYFGVLPDFPLRKKSIPITPGVSVKSEDLKKPDVAEAAGEKVRTVPPAFERFDFKNHFYERYRLFSGKKMRLALKDGDQHYDYADSDRGWFSFDNVFYTDVTGDGNPEAVVLLSHVQCGVSCDGGAALIYIYSVRKGKLQTLWRYETGSLAYGCGLKSLTINARQITLETFGRCLRPATEYPGSGKFFIPDLTRSVFRFKRRRFTRRSVEIISRPATDVKNYQSEIRIS